MLVFYIVTVNREDTPSYVSYACDLSLLASLNLVGDIFPIARYQYTEPDSMARRQRIWSNYTRHSASFIGSP